LPINDDLWGGEVIFRTAFFHFLSIFGKKASNFAF